MTSEQIQQLRRDEAMMMAEWSASFVQPCCFNIGNGICHCTGKFCIIACHRDGQHSCICLVCYGKHLFDFFPCQLDVVFFQCLDCAIDNRFTGSDNGKIGRQFRSYLQICHRCNAGCFGQHIQG